MVTPAIAVNAVFARLNAKERELFFGALLSEVFTTFGRLDAKEKLRWAAAARKLVEILQIFQRDPSDKPGCSMTQALDLVCEFSAQACHPANQPASRTKH
ncbi:hypothetical protein AGR4C_pb30040 [Agrobacterium tumefaciens str. Kerr 14]|uniref:Uncharacterized protein n=1 Tax=Agrobacterium tumefaciens str. Kerr 14 TaxID=1183424 RepID=A0A1S7SG24_AGRTU|nr:hypothetical protein [Agrobacterium tumefaciens]CUX67944.1 hypothetical protein AGR4C_pb30040 [Agrobacterium tumefaciens str. Kerr 14]